MFNVRQGRVGTARLMPNAVQILAAGSDRRGFFQDMRGAVSTSIGLTPTPLYRPISTSHIPSTEGSDILDYLFRPADVLFLGKWGVSLPMPYLALYMCITVSSTPSCCMVVYVPDFSIPQCMLFYVPLLVARNVCYSQPLPTAASITAYVDTVS
jgi:hypothetical protein